MALNGDAAELFRGMTKEMGNMELRIVEKMAEHRLEQKEESGKIWSAVKISKAKIEALPCNGHDARINCASRWQKIGVAIGASIMIIIPLLLYLWKAKP